MKPFRKILSTQEAALKLGVNARTARRWFDDGKLDGFIVSGRRYIYEDAIDQFLIGLQNESA